MALELATEADLSLNDILPDSFRAASAHYLGFGRNAWHSTWVDSYYPRSVSLDVSEIKRQVEGQRWGGQGNVYWIKSIPLLIIRYSDRAIALAAINDKSSYEYKQLRQEIASYPSSEYWRAFPNYDQGSLRLFRYDADRSRPKKFEPCVCRSYSYGGDYKLCWRTFNSPPDYDGFLKFERWLRRRLHKLRRNSLAAH